MIWFDAHNHLHHLPDPHTRVREMLASGVSHAVVNATEEAEWETLAQLIETFPDHLLPAFGIHPWKAHTATPGWDERLAQFLERYPQASLGECGLDRWITTPTLDQQQPVFTRHLQLAHTFKRPITLHILKAWEPLFDTFRNTPPPDRFLLHSFAGSPEIAHRLLHLGAHFSFSGYFLHPRKHAVIDVFRHLPAHRWWLETDAPDMLPPPNQITHPLPTGQNHPANLPAIGLALAHHLELDPQTLAQRTTANATSFFQELSHHRHLPRLSPPVQPP